MVKSRFANEVKDSPDSTPDLIKYVEQNQIVGFDGVEDPCSQNNQHQRSAKVFASPPALEINTVASENCIDEQFPNHQRKHSVSISMPSSPVRDKSEFFADNDEFKKGFPNQLESNAYTPEPKRVKFLSQPMPKGVVLEEGMNSMNFPTDPKFRKFRDKRYDSFKTWSGRLERQITHLRGGPTEDPSPDDDDDGQRSSRESIPVHRFFDALEGPELDALRPSEEILLPEDKTWPFLLRYPISSFGICLGVSSQAILWKAMATSESTKFLHISLKVNLVLWFISLALVAVVASTYLLKIIFYFEAVRREYYHPIRVNFFFAPWIALLFIAIGLPPSIAETLPQALWYVLMTPFLCLELKIYGQWMSGGQRRLSKVANPSNHLSIVGNFVGALLGASLGLKEGPIFFFAIGLAHYTVLFVTLYQRLPTNETLPKELHPVFFLFVAAPSVASMAWARIHGSFDFGSKIAYFIALFLYFSLAVRVNFFRGFTFSLSWWAYTFPMTGAAIATIRYANVVDTVVTKALVLILSAIATLVVTALLVTTIIHAFVLRKLFPNDISIAISDRKPKHHHRTWFHKRNGSAEPSDIENYLKYSTSEGDDSKGSPK